MGAIAVARHCPRFGGERNQGVGCRWLNLSQATTDRPRANTPFHCLRERIITAGIENYET